MRRGELRAHVEVVAAAEAVEELELGRGERQPPVLVLAEERDQPAPERLQVGPDCGMKYLSHELADAKLRALVEGARIVRERL